MLLSRVRLLPVEEKGRRDDAIAQDKAGHIYVSTQTVTIAASSPGVGGMINFSSQYHHNRSGLALSDKTVYVTFAAHEDQGPYHGWLLGYSTADLTQSRIIFNTAPNGGSGGIWAGGGAPAIDSAGDVYVTTGNGLFDALPLPSFNDYGDSILRLNPFHGTTPNGVNLRVANGQCGV